MEFESNVNNNQIPEKEDTYKIIDIYERDGLSQVTYEHDGLRDPIVGDSVSQAHEKLIKENPHLVTRKSKDEGSDTRPLNIFK